MNDRFYMNLAIEISKKGIGNVSPNPLVGAVIVKNNKIIGTGYHKKYGEPHAEVNALKNCTESPKGSTIYVTLEPCCHKGKQPPCTEAIIQAGISKVVIGAIDPNPKVQNKGVEILRKNNIEVITGVLEKECIKTNEVFFHYIENKTPFVLLKYAMSLDGKIATYTGDSKWVTGEKSRENVHSYRSIYSGIMVGIGTVLADDPMLNSRIGNGKNPIRIICDTDLQIPESSNIVKSAKDIKTIIATSSKDLDKISKLESLGCNILNINKQGDHLDLTTLMEKLRELKIDSILVEGGGTLNWSLVEKGLVNKVQAYIAPKLIGGKNAKTPIEGQGFEKIKDVLNLENCHITQFDDDFLIEGDVKNVYRNS